MIPYVIDNPQMTVRRERHAVDFNHHATRLIELDSDAVAFDERHGVLGFFWGRRNRDGRGAKNDGSDANRFDDVAHGKPFQM